MEVRYFGTTDKGDEATLYCLQNKNGMEVQVTDHGAVLIHVYVPDKDGKKRDVILGHPNFEDYNLDLGCHGAPVGRNANRIDGASFELNGKTYQLFDTGNNLNLHSKPDAYFYRMYNAETEIGDDGESVTFFMTSPDGDQGFPGNLELEITYTLTQDNELMIDYYGLSDQDTIFNITNHSYFNVNGRDYPSILKDRVWIDADCFTETDDRLIPTGKVVDVTGTPMDFRVEKEIGQDIDADYYALKQGGGYDHNFVVNGGVKAETANLVAYVIGADSGIKMEVYTDLPGVQIYTGKRNAICFETQFSPDAIHHPNFASPVIKAGEETRTLTVYRFLTEE